MDSNKKVSFNTTMRTQTFYTTSNSIQDDNKLVKDIQTKIHSILKGENAESDYSHRFKCKVPLLQTTDGQKLCNKLIKFNENYKIAESDKDQIAINSKVLKSYKFNSVISKRRLTKSQQQKTTIQNTSHHSEDKYNKIFNTEWSEYQNIYDLHNLLTPNSLDMGPAYAEVQFIKSKIKKRHQDTLVLPKSNRNVIENNKPKKFIDLDQIYLVQPNQISTSRVVLKSTNNRESKSQRRHQAFQN
ncbi:unnamed protein product (macronuclear) [Paramecium tetraurelia]|uniref:Uncharacterized protein n=1 Tax=Paramecium tetraurelia TaxID=5888 RepID=A0DA12_PARTE|nr:uncharacterized protein GSPATT00014811001 [Paramecium tetraurelia]CAK79879.1 unnamed protein product [Paramecium tetraurelia]|eukprot:XP_001447276.1 hypothetical protein (macronuclear) [Paramecium tetraurelia strain d4-2]